MWSPTLQPSALSMLLAPAGLVGSICIGIWQNEMPCMPQVQQEARCLLPGLLWASRSPQLCALHSSAQANEERCTRRC